METIELLKSLEIELLQSDTRHNLVRIDELLADDFFECGKYGDRFDKKECLESLPKESEEKKLEATEIKIYMLSETLAQVRYVGRIQNP